MKNKMVKNLNGGAFNSCLKLPLFQKLDNVQFFVPQKSFKNNSIKAFSVAEAMIAMLIGSLILGCAAPMISKQMKVNNASDVQFSLIMRRLEAIEKGDNVIPKGTVAFFSNNVVAKSIDDPCPRGWSLAPVSWNGRFLKVADSAESRNELQEQSIQEHWHNLPTLDLSSLTGARWQDWNPSNAWVYADAFDAEGHFENVKKRSPNSAFAGNVFRVKDNFIGHSADAFPDAVDNEQTAPAVSDDNETRPKNVSLLVCIKD